MTRPVRTSLAYARAAAAPSEPAQGTSRGNQRSAWLRQLRRRGAAAWAEVTPNMLAAYALAGTIGLLFVLSTVGLRLALGLGVDDSFLNGDVTQHIIGQRYFIADAWRWPLLVTRLLEGPQGVNISLTDSIPLAALAAKLFRGVLPAGYTIVYPWLALAFLLQPVAGVYALRGTGERRLLPAIFVAILALSAPTLLYRVGHIALCSHFLLLFAIGLYLRITRDGQARFGRVTLLLCIALLVHPYLLVMVAAILAAAPVTLLGRGRGQPWLTVLNRLLLALALTACVALLLGYGGESPGGGFGDASMNLVSPFYPRFSSIFSWIAGHPAPAIDPTGLQYEGYQYLGAGLLLLLAVIVLTRRQAIARSLQQHFGVWVVGAALSILAISTTVYAGNFLLLKVSNVPEFMNQFRSSGRFFWPVTYFLLIGSVWTVMQVRQQRAALALLVVAAGLQWADMSWLRLGLSQLAGPHPAPPAEDLRLSRLFAEHRKVTIWPSTACGQTPSDPLFMRLLRAASDHVVPVNTMYLARETDPSGCDPAAIVATPLARGEIRVFMPQAIDAAAAVPDGPAHCRMFDNLALCSRSETALAGLPAVPAPPSIPIGKSISMSRSGQPSPAVVGWYLPEEDGRWTRGHTAILAGRFSGVGDRPVRLTVRLDAVADEPFKAVTLRVDGTTVDHWSVRTGKPGQYQAEIPAGLLHDGTHLLRFEIAHPARTSDFKRNSDDSRLIGLYVMSLRFDTD